MCWGRFVGVQSAMIKAGIFGATGYTGVELVRILSRHGKASVFFAASESYAGHQLSDVLPCAFDTPLVKTEDAPVADVDVIFSCLPHGASAELCQRAYAMGKPAIDLSADFRLRDPAVYAKWYQQEHPYPGLLEQAVYGLPEVYRIHIADASLVANPGCYPTSVILGALPLLELGALAEPVIIADSKSGVSGAGRKPTLTTHFVEVNENLAPYNIGRAHRHVPEIEQGLNDVAVLSAQSSVLSTEHSALSTRHSGLSVIFTPHLLPISRGMLSTLYFRLSPEAAGQDWRAIYAQRYDGEPFVRVLPKGQIATIAHAVNTNYCAISVGPLVESPGGAPTLIVVSAIDNLIKGASGQAVQNMNLMFGFDEREGLM
jgi:N-acetyl-gamma-glutamyl-phosphate reductase